MKRLMLILLSVICPGISLAQPLCDFKGKDSLTILVVADTINIWDLAACGNCASLFATNVTLSSDTLYIMQEDTSNQTALCDCLFNLRTSFSGAAPGTYRAVIHRDWHKKYPFLSEPLLIGSIQFDYNPHASSSLSYGSYQSKCLTDAVLPQSRDLPERCALLPNFPNPFNPSTTIWFQTTTRQYVELKVFDPLGRCVGTLVSEMQLPGLHSVRFDAASRLSSGSYYVRMSAGEFSQTRMIVLAR